MTKADRIASAVIKHLNVDVDTVTTSELQLLYSFGELVCELEDKNFDLSEQSAAEKLKQKFLDKIK